MAGELSKPPGRVTLVDEAGSDGQLGSVLYVNRQRARRSNLEYNYAAEESLVPTADGCSSTYRERVALTFLRMTQWFLPLGRS
jgi:hypothetical protein